MFSNLQKTIGLKDAVIQYGPGGSEELPFQPQAPRANHMATSTICGFVEAPCQTVVSPLISPKSIGSVVPVPHYQFSR